MITNQKKAIYRASEQAMRNRKILAHTAERSPFKPWEIWIYLIAATVFPFIRAIYQMQFKTPKIPVGGVVFGSRKRALYRPVLDGTLVMDDLEYDWSPQTWRFMSLGIAFKYYGVLLQNIAFIARVAHRTSVWSAAHYAVCLLEWTYLKSVIEKSPSPKSIYSGYYIDRKALLLTQIHKDTKFELIGLQHGAFNVFPRLYRGFVDRIILMFPFSRMLATDFFRISDSERIMVAPEDFEFGWVHLDTKRPFVVYGASADSSILNREIVAALDTHLPSEYDIWIKLHPRDSVGDYADLEQGRVKFSAVNAINASAYCGQLSSVIAEAWSLNLPIAVMKGATRRNSDFQLMLGDDVCNSAAELALSVSNILSKRI